jgi:hypothetical protein
MFSTRREQLYITSLLGTYDPLEVMVQGTNGTAGRRLSPPSPLGGTWTAMTEPCAALPRKGLFAQVYQAFLGT